MAEKVILKGNARLLKPVIAQMIAMQQLINNRDIGQIVAQKLERELRANPQTLTIAITWYSVPAPPWVAPDGQKLVEVEYNISDVVRAKCDWATIKAVAGGNNGFMWGKHRCNTYLDNKRQQAVYGATPEEAEEVTDRLLTLTTADIWTQNTSEEKKKGRRLTNPRLQKEATRVYPAYFTIINQQKLADADQKGIPSVHGNLYRKDAKIYLWTNEKPADADEKIQDALSNLYSA